MKSLIKLSLLLIITTCWAQEVIPVVEKTTVAPLPIRTPQQPIVQLAILLDTSGSMEGLIDQAKTQLWSIVNEFIFAKRGGAAPQVQVALYEYGNDSLTTENGFIRQVLPLTTDLDQVSQALFALTTNGGSEYCGWVIQEAIKGLAWDTNPATLKTVFIAGNEAFTQGSVDYRISCKAAIESGILVNTIHCGDEATGRQGQWHLGAQLADGRFLNINQDQAVAYIEAPQDKEIAALNLKLNDTYMAFGTEGLHRKNMQISQDTNASSLNAEAFVQRSVAKASANYRNDSWDLVDALKEKKVKLEELSEDQLPAEIKAMSPEKRKEYIAAKAKEREVIQNQIQALNKDRLAFITEEGKKNNIKDQSLGAVIVQVVREQAQAKGYEFSKPQKKPGTDPK